MYTLTSRNADNKTRKRALIENMARFRGTLGHEDSTFLNTTYFTDRYFDRAAATVKHAGRDPIVTMQVFTKKSGMVAGILEALAMLPAEVEVQTLNEGDEVEPWEPVMHITGPYTKLARLETPLLGVLARRSLVATNMNACVTAASGKPVIFMAARHDDFRVQEGDGYAALIAGAREVSTNANANWHGITSVGTIPHALIAAFNGNTAEATLAFASYVEESEQEEIGSKDVIALVDYENNCWVTAIEVCAAMKMRFGHVPAAVRLDTSEKLQDYGLGSMCEGFGREKLTGVCPTLVNKVRDRLDHFGFEDVGIVVSGGFTPAKIASFEAAGLPVDAYGVGSSIIGHNDGSSGLLSGMDFTADIVEVDGREESKVGRKLIENPRLVTINPTTVKDNFHFGV